jgi:hypothetical protein
MSAVVFGFVSLPPPGIGPEFSKLCAPSLSKREMTYGLDSARLTAS